jgi:hypothetical protein
MVEIYKFFEGEYYMSSRKEKYILKMEAVGSSETSLNFHQITWRHMQTTLFLTNSAMKTSDITE